MIRPNIISLLTGTGQNGSHPAATISEAMPPLSLTAFMLPVMYNGYLGNIQGIEPFEKNWQTMTGKALWW